MDSYEKMENEMMSFKKYLKMTMDILCDSYKWHKLSAYTENPEEKEKYKQIGNMLYEMFLTEHKYINKIFKGE